MEIDFETWKKLVEGAKITKVELERPNSLFFEFDTGMVCYVYSEKPLEFNYNWLEGYEFLSKKATELHVRKMIREIEAEEVKRQIREKHLTKKHSGKSATIHTNNYVEP